MNKLWALVMGMLVTAAAGGIAYAAEKPIKIVNGTNATMVAVQVRATGTKPWTPVEQRKPLGFKGTLPVPPVDGTCRQYDIQVLFDDGHRVVKLAKRLCPNDSFTVTDY